MLKTSLSSNTRSLRFLTNYFVILVKQFLQEAKEDFLKKWETPEKVSFRILFVNGNSQKKESEKKQHPEKTIQGLNILTHFVNLNGLCALFSFYIILFIFQIFSMIIENYNNKAVLSHLKIKLASRV